MCVSCVKRVPSPVLSSIKMQNLMLFSNSTLKPLMFHEDSDLEPFYNYESCKTQCKTTQTAHWPWLVGWLVGWSLLVGWLAVAMGLTSTL